MENMIKKFMDSLNLKLHINCERIIKAQSTGDLYCFITHVHREKNNDSELSFYSCWSKKKNSLHDIKFEGANWNKSAKNGVFAYLGNYDEVDKYFNNLTKDYAKKYILENQSY